MEGSPAAVLQAALRLTGASEGIRQNRIASAQRVLEQIGGASIMPSASQFLQVGANRASQAASIQVQTGLARAQALGQPSQWPGAIGKLVGMGAGALIGGPVGAAFGGQAGGLLMGGGQQNQAVPMNDFERYYGAGTYGLFGGGGGNRTPFDYQDYATIQ